MFLDLMLKFYVQTQLFFKRKEGASGIEYAIIVALVALVIVGAGTGLGTKISAIFTNMATKMPTGT
ncbi:Flp family type IVb pilin [Pseudomonas sp. S09G 359]|jgi:pilus assembly protein Flp/PilA|uniref:Flp family type IVb pilin n=1 Tax=Pseudomonas sp. S09G 359 TaxID=2054919 RepID=UPI000C6E6FA6|nr:Flp family type IVb pilin [Pseudomonas sp. S09G 359]AUG05667.1 Flp family type IVb pilin [Pseudomonas sp. S09G 359]